MKIEGSQPRLAGIFSSLPCDWRNPRSLLLTRSCACGQLQLGQQRFGVPEIRGIEAFGELIVNRLYQLQSFRTATLVLPKTSQITGGAQLPGARLLMTSDLQAIDEQSLDFLGRAAGGQEEASLDAQDFGDGPSFTGLFRNQERLLDDLQCGIAMACLGVSLGLERQEYRQP